MNNVCHLLVFMLVSILTQAARDNECTKALPMPIRKALQNELCGSSSPGIGPAQCATTSRKVSPSWQTQHIADLCRNAQSSAPASCVGGFKVGTAPVEVMIGLCAPLGEVEAQNDSAITGPSDCFTSAPRGWPTSDIAWLCQRSVSEPNKSPPIAAQCALQAMKNKHFRTGSTSPLAASVCQGASSPEGPIDCAFAASEALAAAAKAKYAGGAESSLSVVSQLCQGAVNAWPGKCYMKASSSKSAGLSEANKVALCRNAISVAPADCALSKSLAKLDPTIRVALCSSGGEETAANQHDGTVEDHWDSSVSVDTSAGVAACAEAGFPMFNRNGAENSLLVSLCSGATGLGPTQCLNKAPLTIDMPSRVKLCRGAEDDGPAKCFKAIRTLRVTHGTGLRDLKEAILLCRGAQSSAPADCLEQAPREMSVRDRVSLCSKAINKAPAECALRGWRVLPTQGVVRLCQGIYELPPPPTPPEKQTSYSPPSKKKGLNKKGAAGINVQDSHPAVSYGGPSDCGLAAWKSGLVRGNTDREIAHQLYTLCHHADIRAVEQCLLKEELLGETPHGAHLPPQARIELCQGATSEVKAKCASAAGGRSRDIDSKTILALCAQATSVTPGACANHVVRHEMKVLTPSGVDKCRKATSIPFNLRIDKMWWDGGDMETNHESTMRRKIQEEAGEWGQAKKSDQNDNTDSSSAADTRGMGLFTMRTVHVIISLLDQYEWPLSECKGCQDDGSKSIVVASASIPKGGGLDANGGVGDLSGLKTNTSLSGVVEFHSLRFTASGEYDLKFHLNRAASGHTSSHQGGSSSKAMQLIRVKVEAHEDDGLGPLGQCGRKLYGFLSSFIDDVRYEERGIGASNTAIEMGVKVALIGSPSAITALNLFNPLVKSSKADEATTEGSSSDLVVTCADILSAADIHVSAGWGGSLWVKYRPVVFALDSSDGLPSSMLDPCQRLGIADCKEPGQPSPRAVRSAYYKASLLWHPDRWATFSEPFQRAAQDQFELISESYRELGGGNSKQQTEGDGEENKFKGGDVILYL